MIINIDDTNLSPDFITWISKLSAADMIKILQVNYDNSRIVRTTSLKDNIPEVSSHKLGIIGEQEIIDLLSQYELQFNLAHKGDIVVKKDGKSLIIEVKNYTSTVPYTEVDKFYRDLDCNASYIGGIFISLNSKISKIDKSIKFSKHNNQYVIFLSVCDKNIITSMVNLLFEIGCYTTVDCNKLISAINELEEIKNCINTCTSVFGESKAIFDKNYNLFARKMETLNEKFNKMIVNLSSYIDTNESVAIADIVTFIKERFPESLAAKTQSHLDYIGKLSGEGNINIKNKSSIEYGDSRIDLLKTKTYLYIPCDRIKNVSLESLLLYDVSVDSGVIKIEICNKNARLLDIIFV